MGWLGHFEFHEQASSDKRTDASRISYQRSVGAKIIICTTVND
jgi:hypothetical protein